PCAGRGAAPPVRGPRLPARAVLDVRHRLTAEVHGACVGAGVELAAFAAKVVADPATTFRLPEVGMGLVPGSGGTWSLTHRIGSQRTNWLALTGSSVGVGTAERWGLVDDVSTATLDG
ncbi:MAG TPA: enoyl-CoA hydratase/isomerase family protein, partial [Acidimicrobiales bacterium]|nr:enoyl-CoA hydratase/isomerase family protein [Acidimicrobiales bacterium]